ncbi:hypothetical protein [Streptomyces sp. NPDC052179]|uniref:hypothetical protein n=1 Tax=Streptomyces sp. NPDC052179 TaxID=3155680 RepID=UPI00341D9F29
MATYSHRCDRCDSSSPPTSHADALAAQEYHRDQVHGGHMPHQGDRIVLHPTGWADADSTDRWIMIGGILLVIIVVLVKL